MKYLTVKKIEKGISFGLLDSEKKDSLKIEEFKEVKELTPENFEETYKKYNPEAIEEVLLVLMMNTLVIIFINICQTILRQLV